MTSGKCNISGGADSDPRQGSISNVIVEEKSHKDIILW